MTCNPWMAAQQASLSFTVSLSLLKLMSIELVMSSNQLILCHPLLHLPSIFPSIRVFSNEPALASGGQGIGASASALPMNIRSCSVAKLCLTLCDPMDCSMLGLPVPHYLLEFAQVHVHWIGDAIQHQGWFPVKVNLLIFVNHFPQIIFSLA